MFAKEKAAEKQVDAALGTAVRIMMRTGYADRSIGSLRADVLPALLLDQYAVWSDVQGEAVGFACWAFLSPEVSERSRSGTKPALHFSEWNEGLIPWVLTACVLPHHAAGFARHLRRTTFAAHDEVWAWRPDGRNAGGRALRLGRIRPRGAGRAI